MIRSRQKQMTEKPNPLEIIIAIHEKFLPIFSQLLGQGFTTGIRTGSTVKALLRDQLGFEEVYIENRIQTLFLDGKAVDNLNSTMIESGAVLALSGAMPGLAGATLRRGGFYGKMRGEISHRKDIGSDTCRESNVTVKLFNLILKELGPLFLKKGILVNGDDFHRLLNAQPDRFRTGCRTAEMDGESIDPEKLTDADWIGSEVLLQIRSGNF